MIASDLDLLSEVNYTIWDYIIVRTKILETILLDILVTKKLFLVRIEGNNLFAICDYIHSVQQAFITVSLV